MVVDRVYQVFCECATWKEEGGKEKVTKKQKELLGGEIQDIFP